MDLKRFSIDGKLSSAARIPLLLATKARAIERSGDSDKIQFPLLIRKKLFRKHGYWAVTLAVTLPYLPLSFQFRCCSDLRAGLEGLMRNNLKLGNLGNC